MSNPDLCPIEPAAIANCVMVLDEVDKLKVEQLVKAVFENEESWADVPGGSQFQRWYRRIASGASAVKMTDSKRKDQGVHGRLIAWKKGKPFAPNSLFSRSLDTSRLLPMHLARFNIQMYGHPSAWELLDNSRRVTRRKWQAWMLVGMMHELLLLRNMHDRGGGDIPVILIDWSAEHIARAMDYWVRLSEGKWSEEERNEQYAEVRRTFCRNLRPCFPQADLLVRSLLHDPAVGYVAPFIVFYPTTKDGRASALFTTPANCPPKSMLNSWPKSCNAPACTEKDCGFFNFDACRSLVKDSPMVRKSVWPTGQVLCNLWGCDKQHAPDAQNPTVLQRCKRCKETLYCSTAHQTIDWNSHKNVCEASSRSAPSISS